MLRESTQEAGESINFKVVSGDGEAEGDIPQAQLLSDFAEAVVRRDAERTGNLRSQLVDLMGGAGLVDACAIAAAFHGFVRVADATGIPVDDDRLSATTDLRDELGINDFREAV